MYGGTTVGIQEIYIGIVFDSKSMAICVTQIIFEDNRENDDIEKLIIRDFWIESNVSLNELMLKIDEFISKIIKTWRFAVNIYRYSLKVTFILKDELLHKQLNKYIANYNAKHTTSSIKNIHLNSEICTSPTAPVENAITLIKSFFNDKKLIITDTIVDLIKQELENFRLESNTENLTSGLTAICYSAGELLYKMMIGSAFTYRCETFLNND